MSVHLTPFFRFLIRFDLVEISINPRNLCEEDSSSLSLSDIVFLSSRISASMAFIFASLSFLSCSSFDTASLNSVFSLSFSLSKCSISFFALSSSVSFVKIRFSRTGTMATLSFNNLNSRSSVCNPN
uniref:Uncharacterized protein n=1 Tax=Rhizophora mucronata TaxID=61149 RepID=A0A2P2P408_RHIMU